MLTFCDQTKPGKTNITSSAVDVTCSQIREDANDKLSKHCWQYHSEIKQQKQWMNSLLAENLKLQQLLHLKLFLDAISHDVSSTLKIVKTGQNLYNKSSGSSGFVSKPI